MAKDDLETIIVNFISDQVESAGAGGAVLGLSGGLDSATAAFLAVRALGPERVIALILPEAGFGDAALDILPIAALYKDEVRALSRRIGVPDRIIEKAPTAGLWPGQTDEVELGISYDDANAILRGMEEGRKGRSRVDLAAEFGPEKLALIERGIASGRHKRELPPTPEI